MKILDNFLKYFVGILFIFSGLIKVNDPIGTSIKLKEYFEVFASDFAPFFKVFIPYTLVLAVLVVVLEVLLGIALLLHYRMKLTSWLFLLLIAFFTFLTFWSAYFNQVTDCGCFGDAIPLTPWESFYKDVILSALILVLWWGRDELFDRWPKWLVSIKLIAIPLFCFGLTYHVLNHLPVVDFRAYAEGKSIVEGMKSAEELSLEPPQYEVLYTMENSEGLRQEISSTQYVDEKWWEKKEWRMLSELSKTIKVKE